MKKIKIVVDCRMIKMAGIGTYISNILPGLINTEYFDIVCLGYNNLREYDWFSQVEFIPVKSRIFSFMEHWELYSKIPRCDIYWSPNWNSTIFKLPTRRRFTTIHDVYHLANPGKFGKTKLSMVKFLMQRLIRTSDYIITVSEFSKTEILNYLRCPVDKIRVAHLGVQDDFNTGFTPTTINDNYILMVGNVKPHKNIEIVLKAFSSLQELDLKLYIVGKREGFITGYRDFDSMLATVDDRVVFTGYVSDSELKNYYAHAKAFIFPSKYEGFGLPILEAMKFNLPVLASNVSALPEVGGKLLNYFDPENEEQVRSLIQALAKNSIKVDPNEYRNHLEQFKWEKTIESHIEWFKRSLLS